MTFIPSPWNFVPEYLNSIYSVHNPELVLLGLYYIKEVRAFIERTNMKDPVELFSYERPLSNLYKKINFKDGEQIELLSQAIYRRKDVIRNWLNHLQTKLGLSDNNNLIMGLEFEAQILNGNPLKV